MCRAVDISVYHGGFHADLNETMFVGKVDERSHKLVQAAYDCMMAGIKMGTLYVVILGPTVDRDTFAVKKSFLRL